MTEKPITSKDEQEKLQENIGVTGTVLPSAGGVLLKITNKNKKLVHCVKVRYSLILDGEQLRNSTVEVYEVPAGESRYAFDNVFTATDKDMANALFMIDDSFEDIIVDQTYEYKDVTKFVTCEVEEKVDSAGRSTVTYNIQNKYASGVSVPLIVVFYDANGNIVDLVSCDVSVFAKDTQPGEIWRTPLSGGGYIPYDHYEVIYYAYKK